jgi:long-chain acyl-CoA synthetase
MGLLSDLNERYCNDDSPFLLQRDGSLAYNDIMTQTETDYSDIRAGDVIALIGDFERQSILNFLRLIDLGVTIVPLTVETRIDHDYFFETAQVDFVVEGDTVRRLRDEQSDHPMLAELRRRGHPGLVLFSSGTTGRPKAILHDFETFLVRFRQSRPTLRTLNFLLFDHIGGINTLLHTLYNKGSVVVPSGTHTTICDGRYC